MGGSVSRLSFGRFGIGQGIGDGSLFIGPFRWVSRL